MKIHEGEQYLSIGEVSRIIGRGTQTIKNWYEYLDKGASVALPEFERLDGKGTRYFKQSDIAKLEAFRDSVKYGAMAEISRTKWGVRGKRENAK